MFTAIATLALAAIQAVTAPAPAPAPAASPTPSPAMAIEAQNQPRIATAAQLLRDHQPDQALDVLTIAIAAYEAARADEKRRLYCGMSMTESLLYMGMAAKDKTDAITVAPGYCTALYLKGYALTDLGRIAEAKATYERVITLAPMHAQYLTELGQLARVEKDWPRMLSTCERAGSAAAIASAEVKPVQQGAALRCQGYALVEEHKLDEAEKRYQAALAIDPADAKSQGELRYIAQQRAKH